MDNKVIRIAADELFIARMNTKIAAIRWDLIPWGLVLDVDVMHEDDPDYEADEHLMKRGWVVFWGIDGITWTFENDRFPTGCWVRGGLDIEPVADGFQNYSFRILTGRFNKNGEPLRPAYEDVTICAKRAAGVISRRSTACEAYGLSREARQTLASDDEMLSALGDFLRTE